MASIAGAPDNSRPAAAAWKSTSRHCAEHHDVESSWRAGQLPARRVLSIISVESKGLQVPGPGPPRRRRGLRVGKPPASPSPGSSRAGPGSGHRGDAPLSPGRRLVTAGGPNCAAVGAAGPRAAGAAAAGFQVQAAVSARTCHGLGTTSAARLSASDVNLN